MTITQRIDGQITLGYPPERMKEIGDWGFARALAILLLPTVAARRAALKESRDAAPYIHIRRAIDEAIIQLAIERGF